MEKQDFETLDDHLGFYKVIKRICEGDYVLSSVNILRHIATLQNSIEVFIKTEEALQNSGKHQKVFDAKIADRWLSETRDTLINSGVTLRWNKKLERAKSTNL